MNRSLWPSGVEVGTATLENETNERIKSIRQGLVDSTSLGITSGLVVTINGTNKVDVTAGSGYAPNGDFMSLSTPQYAQVTPVTSTTLNVVSYVILMYSETLGRYEAHESSGATLPTKATTSPRLIVVLASDYNAFVATSQVMATNAKDRALILATLTGNGTSFSIALPNSFNPVLKATQPSNITGVTVLGVSSDTPVGNGVLTWTVSGATLKWHPAGDTDGATVPVTVSGIYNVISTAGHVIRVNIAISVLPLTNKTDTIVITNVYIQSIPRFSAIDAQHRSLVGTGVPSTTNPHGMTLDDLSPGTGGSIEFHQDIMHSNGIARVSQAGLLSCSITQVPIGYDFITAGAFNPGDLVYINGKKVDTLIGSNIVDFTTAPFSTNYATFLIYLTQDATLQKMVRCEYTTATGIQAIAQIVNVSNKNYNGAYTISISTSNMISFEGGEAVTVPTVDSVVRLYDSGGVDWVEAFVKTGAAPGSTLTDTITFYAAPNAEENLYLAYAPWDPTTANLGYGWPTADIPHGMTARGITDLRTFGTLGKDEISSSAGYVDVERLIIDSVGDGIALVYYGQDGAGTNNQLDKEAARLVQFKLDPTSPNATVHGGTVYLGGKRVDVQTRWAIPHAADTTWCIYVTQDGTIHSDADSWINIIAAQGGKPIQRLYDFAVSGGAIVGTPNDWRTYIDRSKPPVSIGSYVPLLTNDVVNISATGGSAATLTVGTGVSNGVSIKANANGNGDAMYGESTGGGRGVHGKSGSNDGVFGETTGVGYAIKGSATGTGRGVHGEAVSSYGVNGLSVSGVGVHGSSSTNYGIFGEGGSPATNSGVAGTIGIRGNGGSGAAGIQGQGGVAVEGSLLPFWVNVDGGPGGIFRGGIKTTTTAGGVGVIAYGATSSGTHGLIGKGDGISAEVGVGVYGTSTLIDGSVGSYTGVMGETTSGYGMYGKATSGAGVYGLTINGGVGVYGEATVVSGTAIEARGTSSGSKGVHAISTDDDAIYGYTTSTSITKAGVRAIGTYSSPNWSSALIVENGHAKFIGSNPPITASYSNTLTQWNIPKAWLKFEALSAAGNITIDEGFNVNTTVVQTSDSAVTFSITFLTAFADSSKYVAVVTCESGNASHYCGGIGAVNRTGTTYGFSPVDGGISSFFSATQLAGYRFNVVFYGRQ